MNWFVIDLLTSKRISMLHSSHPLFFSGHLAKQLYMSAEKNKLKLRKNKNQKQSNKKCRKALLMIYVFSCILS
jgi:hypothetical protein